MAKITPMDKAISIDSFRKLFMKGILDWEEDERRDMPPKERRRTWWNKDDIMRICNWPGSWSKLRKLLETRIGLIMLRYGAPRKDLCWTFATSKNDRRGLRSMRFQYRWELPSMQPTRCRNSSRLSTGSTH